MQIIDRRAKPPKLCATKITSTPGFCPTFGDGHSMTLFSKDSPTSDRSYCLELLPPATAEESYEIDRSRALSWNASGRKVRIQHRFPHADAQFALYGCYGVELRQLQTV